MPELTLRPLPIDEGTGTAKFDLTLALEETPAEGSPGRSEYNTDLFDAATIDRMLGHFRDPARRRSSPIPTGASPTCRS